MIGNKWQDPKVGIIALKEFFFSCFVQMIALWGKFNMGACNILVGYCSVKQLSQNASLFALKIRVCSVCF